MTNQKVAMVTGAGSGIGKASALALAADGYATVLVGRRRERLEDTAAEAGANATTLVASADVSDPDSVRQLFDQTVETFGRLDVLFNNAGVNTSAALLEDLPFDEWQSIVNINLTGSFLCTQQAFRIMKGQDPQGGRIINNGSISAYGPRPSSAPYTATKHAITGLTKSTILDGRKYNIACGQIDIGNTDTEMVAKIKTGVPQADGITKVEPTFDVAHVAQTIVYMAGLPLDANVSFLTIMATKMPLYGRG